MTLRRQAPGLGRLDVRLAQVRFLGLGQRRWALLAALSGVGLLLAGMVLAGAQTELADREVAAAKERRGTYERISRDAVGLEVRAWRQWLIGDERRIDPVIAFSAAGMVGASREFFADRIREGGPAESAVARASLAALTEWGALIDAALSRGEKRFDAILAQFPDLAARQEGLREKWFAINSVQIASAERERTLWLIALLGQLVAVGLLIAIGALAIAARSARSRRAAMAELRWRAMTDQLTGLANRSEFYVRLDSEVARAIRNGRRLSLALLDIDHFKTVNDEHGHQAGDEVLRAISARLRDHARAGELIARVGGEEFAWILPEATLDDAVVATERARRAVGQQPFAGVGHVTISVGISELAQGLGAGELFRRADDALYVAKQTGRDRIARFVPDLRRAGIGSPGGGVAYDALRAVARAVDLKHPGTAGHSERVADFAARIADQAGWSTAQIARLRQAALVHDVGKIIVPERILTKPGPLTGPERAVLRGHVEYSADLVRAVLDTEQTSWIASHHERWDGSGYPHGQAGGDIPEGALILAIADAWDAMSSDRVYAAALDDAGTLAEFLRGRGRQFWPGGVDVLSGRLLARESRPLSTANA